MKIVSYSKTNDNIKSGGAGGGSGSGSSSEIQNPTGTRGELDREIWGQTDVGDDIDGTMKVNGDVYIKVIEERNFEPDDDEDGSGEDVEYEEGGGNLFVDLKTTTKEIEVSEDAYIKRHLFVNYPEHPGHSDANKKCIGEILKDIENSVKSEETRAKEAEKKNADAIIAERDRATGVEEVLDSSIKVNADEIEKLKNRSDSNETDLSDITTKVENNIVEINTIKEQLADGSALAELQRQVENLKYGNYSTPIILFAGILRKYSTTDSYMYNGSYKDCIQFRITDISDGLMTIELTPSTSDRNMYIYVRSVNATQEMSDDTNERKTYYKERSNGAHWFESWFTIETNKTTIFLREFHQGNGDNDTWYSSSWFEGGGIRAVNLTINGYINFL